jgi:hypothetical protein
MFSVCIWVKHNSDYNLSNFVIYINDMPWPDTLKCNVRLFADDTIVYLTISALTDCHTLQSDLHKLEKWEEEWFMSFNPDKCVNIHISSVICKETNVTFKGVWPWHVIYIYYKIVYLHVFVCHVCQ